MTRLRRGLFAGVVLGFLVVIAAGLLADIRAVGALMRSFPVVLVPLVLAGTLFNYALRFAKWHFYLGLVGAGGLPVGESARLFVAGFPLALSPGKLAEALKAVWIERKTGVPFARALPVVAAERVSDGMAVLLLSTLGVLAYPHLWPGFALLWVVLLGIVIASRFEPVVRLLLGRLGHLGLVARLSRPLLDLIGSADALFRPGPLLAAVGLGTLAWFGEGLGFFVILVGLGMPATPTTLGLAVFTLALSTAVGGASTLPGGLGAAETSLTGLLTLVASIPLDLAVTATLMIRFATLWFGVGLGLAVWARSADLLGLTPPAAPPSGASFGAPHVEG